MQQKFIHFFPPIILAAALFGTPSSFGQQPRSSSESAQSKPGAEEENQAYRKRMEDADQRIADEVKAHSELMKNLEHLTTEIGPRLTGSPEMEAASHWTLKRFHDYGVDAHLETTQIAHSWQRGNDSAEITSPISRRIDIRSFGWGKSTHGPLSGTVTVLRIKSLKEMEPYKGKLKGAIVLPGEPTQPINEDQADNAYDAVIPEPHSTPKQEGLSWRERFHMLKILADEGVGAVLVDSAKPDNLINMAGGFNKYQPSDVSLAFISHEDYCLLYRLSEQSTVKMTVDLEGKFSPGPVPASITVAEIKGSEFPEERVIIGAHLDSWDLGQGALDNGTGTMAVLEAARVLKALNFKPKRTITFILFTGEEQGGIGADLFLKNHESEIPKMEAILIHDTGTGKVISIALENLWSTATQMKEIYLPLQEIFDLQPLSTRYFGASDHVPFLHKGVPAYFCIQRPDHYGNAHHSQADTFDKVIADEIDEGAALLAAWAWNVSEMEQPLPHHPAATEPPGMMD